MHVSRSNQEWIAALCVGEAQDQEQAYQELGQVLFRAGLQYLYRRQPTATYLAGLASSELEALAQDAVQYTLVQVWQSVCVQQRFKGQANLTTYAIAILNNRIKEILRRRQRIVRPPLRAEDKAQDEAFAEWWRKARGADEDGATPEEETQQGQVWHEIQRISREELSERERLAFWLRHWWDSECDPIADLMSVMYGIATTRNAVYSLIYQARKKLLEALTKAGFGSRTQAGIEL